MAINTSDRLHIYNENARRSTHSLAPMNLDQMVDSLLQLAADKLSFQHQEGIHMVNEDQAEGQQIGRVQEYQGKDRQKHNNYPAQKQGKNEEKRFPKKNNFYKDKQAQQPDKTMRKPFCV